MAALDRVGADGRADDGASGRSRLQESTDDALYSLREEPSDADVAKAVKAEQGRIDAEQAQADKEVKAAVDEPYSDPSPEYKAAG